VGARDFSGSRQHGCCRAVKICRNTRKLDSHVTLTQIGFGEGRARVAQGSEKQKRQYTSYVDFQRRARRGSMRNAGAPPTWSSGNSNVTVSLVADAWNEVPPRTSLRWKETLRPRRLFGRRLACGRPRLTSAAPTAGDARGHPRIRRFEEPSDELR
jgi:hypothetical protein